MMMKEKMEEKRPSLLSEKLIWIEEHIMGCIVMAVTLLLFVNVVVRYVKTPLMETTGIVLPTISWAEEAIRYGIIWITFIAAANAFRRESHFGVDLIFRVKSAAFVKFVRLLGDVGSFVFCGFVLYYGIQMVTFNMGGGQISPSLKLPLWLVYSVIPFSGGLSMLYIIRNFIRKLKTPAAILHEYNNTPIEGDVRK